MELDVARRPWSTRSETMDLPTLDQPDFSQWSSGNDSTLDRADVILNRLEQQQAPAASSPGEAYDYEAVDAMLDRMERSALAQQQPEPERGNVFEAAYRLFRGNQFGMDTPGAGLLGISPGARWKREHGLNKLKQRVANSVKWRERGLMDDYQEEIADVPIRDLVRQSDPTAMQKLMIHIGLMRADDPRLRKAEDGLHIPEDMEVSPEAEAKIRESEAKFRRSMDTEAIREYEKLTGTLTDKKYGVAGRAAIMFSDQPAWAQTFIMNFNVPVLSAIPIYFKTVEKMTPELRLKANGEIEITKEGERLGAAMWMGTKAIGVETVSESVGGRILGKFFPKKARAKLGGAIADAALARQPRFARTVVHAVQRPIQKMGLNSKAVRNGLETLGFHGLPEEIIEEYVAAIAHPLLGTGETEPPEHLKDANELTKRIGSAAVNIWETTKAIPEMAISMALFSASSRIGIRLMSNPDSGPQLDRELTEREKKLLINIRNIRTLAIRLNEKVPVGQRLLMPFAHSQELKWLEENKDNYEELYRVYGGWMQAQSLKEQTDLPTELADILVTAKSQEEFQASMARHERQFIQENYNITTPMQRQQTVEGTRDQIRWERANAFTDPNTGTTSKRYTDGAHGRGNFLTDVALLWSRHGVRDEEIERALELITEDDYQAFLDGDDTVLYYEQWAQELEIRIHAQRVMLEPRYEDVLARKSEMRQNPVILREMLMRHWHSAGVSAERIAEYAILIRQRDIDAFLSGEDDGVFTTQRMHAEWYRRIEKPRQEALTATERNKFRELLVEYAQPGHSDVPVEEKIANVRKYLANLEKYASRRPDKNIAGEIRKGRRLLRMLETGHKRQHKEMLQPELMQVVHGDDEGTTQEKIDGLQERMEAMQKYARRLSRSEDLDAKWKMEQVTAALRRANKYLRYFIRRRSREMGMTPGASKETRARERLMYRQKLMKAVRDVLGVIETSTAEEAREAWADNKQPTDPKTIDRVKNGSDNLYHSEQIGVWYMYRGERVQLIATDSNSNNIQEDLKVIAFIARPVKEGLQIWPVDPAQLTEETAPPVDLSQAPKEAQRVFPVDEAQAAREGAISLYQGLRMTYEAGAYPDGMKEAYYYRLINLREKFSAELANERWPDPIDVIDDSDLSDIEIDIDDIEIPDDIEEPDIITQPTYDARLRTHMIALQRSIAQMTQLKEQGNEAWKVLHEQIQRMLQTQRRLLGMPDARSTQEPAATAQAKSYDIPEDAPEHEVRIPRVNKTMKVKLVVADRSVLRHSEQEGYDVENQGKQNRMDARNAQRRDRIQQIYQQPDMQALLPQRSAADGMPIVDNQMDALVGNGRLTAINMFYDSDAPGRGAQYANAVRAYAEANDVPYLDDNVQQPVLVAVVTIKEDTVVEADMSVREFVKWNNENDQLQMTAAELAVQDARLVRSILDQGIPYETTADGNPTSPANQDFWLAFARQCGDDLLDTRNNPLPVLRDRIEMAMLGLVFEDDPDIALQIVERSHSRGARGLGMERTKNGITASSQSLVASMTAPGYELPPLLAVAVREYISYKTSSAKNIDDYLAQRQQDIYLNPLTEEEVFMLNHIDSTKNSAKAFKALMVHYESRIPDTNTALLGGFDMSLPSRLELLKLAQEKAREEAELESTLRKPTCAAASVRMPAVAPDMSPNDVRDTRRDIITHIPGVDPFMDTLAHEDDGPIGGSISPRDAYMSLKPKTRATLVQIATQVAEAKQGYDDAELYVQIATMLGEGIADRLEPVFGEVWKEVDVLEQEEAKNENDEAAEKGVPKQPGDATEGGEPVGGRALAVTDERAERIIAERDKSAIRSDETVTTFVKGAQQVNIPQDNTESAVKDCGHLLRLHDHATKRRVYPAHERPFSYVGTAPDAPKVCVMAYETGTGKTFAGAMFAKEVIDREREDGRQPKVLWVTKNKALIAQNKQDTEAYGLGDDVTYITYHQLMAAFDPKTGVLGQGLDVTWDAVFFDEADAMKNIQHGTRTAQAGIALRKYVRGLSVYATATPFENPSQLQYLADSGIFDQYPGGFSGWARAHGVDQAGTWHPSTKSALAANEWLRRAGVLVEQKAVLPEGMVEAHLRERKLTPDQKRYVVSINQAFRSGMAHAKKRGDGMAVALLMAQRTMLQRRALESFKIPGLIEQLKAEVEAAKQSKEARKWFVLTATKSERDIEETERRYREMYDAQKAAGEVTAWTEAYLMVQAELVRMGITKEQFPSPIAQLAEAAEQLGLAPERYTGDQTDKQRSQALTRFRQGTSRFMIATMDAGGIGLSAHDAIGGMPITQHVLTMPWTGTKLTQVVGRTARFGMLSPVSQQFHFADTPDDRMLAAKVGTRMHGMKAIVNGLPFHAEASDMIEFNLAMDTAAESALMLVDGEPGDTPSGPLAARRRTQQQPPVAADAAENPALLPDWFHEPIKDKQMQRVASEFANDKDNKKGAGTLVREMAQWFDVDVRMGLEQTTRNRPGSYGALHNKGDVHPGVLRSRAPIGEVTWHEIGHAIWDLMVIENPQAANAMEDDLLPLTDKAVYPDSNASAKNAHEGAAEWVKRYVMYPTSFKGQAIVTAMERFLQQHHPRWLDKLRGAAIAYQVHLNRGDAAVWESSIVDRPDAPAERYDNLAQQFMFNFLSQGAPLDELLKRTATTIADNAEKYNKTRRQAQKDFQSLMDRNKETGADINLAYDMFARQALFMENAIQGDQFVLPYLNGKRDTPTRLMDPVQERLLKHVFGDDIPTQASFGEMLCISNMSFAKAVEGVERKDFHRFMSYGYAKAAAWRAEYKGHAYPGRDDTGLPALKKIIAEYEAQHPEWVQAFENLERLADRILLVSFYTGQKSFEEVLRVKGYELQTNEETKEITLARKYVKYDKQGNVDPNSELEHYWPLEKELSMVPGYTGKGSITMEQRLKPAHGSELQFRDLYDTFADRIQDAVAVWSNRSLFKSMLEFSQAGGRHTELDPMSRKAIAATVVKLKPDLRAVAQIGPTEDQTIRQRIAAYLNEISDSPVPVSASDININFMDMKIWRNVKPNALNVIAFCENGKYSFYQIKDPLLFKMLMKAPQINRFLHELSRIIEPAVRARKKLMTTRPQFTMRNVPRDIGFGYVNMSGESLGIIGAIPAFNVLYGAYKMITGSELDQYISAADMNVALHQHYNNDMQKENRGMKALYSAKDFAKDFTDNPVRAVTMGAVAAPLWAMRGVGRGFELTSKTITLVWNIATLGLAGKSSAFFEMASRRGYAEMVLDRGGSIARALSVMDRSTGHFVNHPYNNSVRTLDRMGGFLNARKQILYAQYQKLSHPDKRVRADWWTRTAVMSILMSGAAWAINAILRGWMDKLEPDDEKRIRLKEYLRRDNRSRMRDRSVLGFELPFTEGPIGYLEAMFVWALDNQLAKKHEIEGPDGAIQFALTTLSRIAEFDAIPGEAAGFIAQFAGFSGKAWGEAALNYSTYRQKHIVPWYMMSFENKKDAVFASTPEAYKVLHDVLSDYLGADIHPLKLQYFMRNGVARDIDETLKLYDSLRGQRINVSRADLPYFGTLLVREGRGWASQPVRSITQLHRDYKKVQSDIKDMREDFKIRGIIDEEEYWQLSDQADDLAVAHTAYELIQDASSRIKDLRNEMKTFQAQGHDDVMVSQYVQEIQWLEQYMTEKAFEAAVYAETMRKQRKKEAKSR